MELDAGTARCGHASAGSGPAVMSAASPEPLSVHGNSTINSSRALRGLLRERRGRASGRAAGRGEKAPADRGLCFAQLLSVFTPPPGIFPVPHWAAITDREDRLTMEDGVPRRDFWGTVSSLSSPCVSG